MAIDHDEQHAVDSSASVRRAISGLKSSGERVTAPRRRIIEVLAATHEHLTADEIAVRLRDEGIHRTTVYRCLDAFVPAGVVAVRQLAAGATAYHLATPGHLHAHCSECHEVIALPSDMFDAVVTDVDESAGFALAPNRSSLVGVCVSCRPPSAAR